MGEVIQPPKNWPGLEAERDGVTYTPRKIGNIARELHKAMEAVGGGGYSNSPGSLQDFGAKGDLTYEAGLLKQVGRWEAGPSFADTLLTAHRELLTVYQDALTNMAAAIALVNEGAGNFGITELGNQGGS
ncbi:hypothetical protein Nocox_05485 [Nonomuraea coxensis DSM 45129]|uniref:PE domain-containing protein n=1 Tax=Nonomuraea coxensis DSM 45129 TaxID=1122611 RepID=A0ABX8TUX2_9ACTN|nr:hypothetical protein [Nonomuraea coxensis]QYC38724.1 hypothetical protein Nocox_05485 [Nonomuraea coxensis DSM 45129]